MRPSKLFELEGEDKNPFLTEPICLKIAYSMLNQIKDYLVKAFSFSGDELRTSKLFELLEGLRKNSFDLFILKTNPKEVEGGVRFYSHIVIEKDTLLTFENLRKKLK